METPSPSIIATISDDRRSVSPSGWVRLIENQQVVDAYGAVCTPHVFAFDSKRVLRYRGRIDDSKDPSKIGVSDLRNALDEMTSGQKVNVPDTKPFGCSIKWLQS